MTEVHISKLLGKLEGFRAIGTNTATNKFCQKMFQSGKSVICGSCYSMKAVTGYRKNMQAALERNSVLLSQHSLSDDQVPVIKDQYFRFSHHGELINELHLLNILKICRKNSGTKFSLWTKRKDIVREVFKDLQVPDNLRLIYSNPKVDAVMNVVPPQFDMVFNNVSKGSEVEQNCTGQKCKDCLLCYGPIKTRFIVEAVK